MKNTFMLAFIMFLHAMVLWPRQSLSSNIKGVKLFLGMLI